MCFIFLLFLPLSLCCCFSFHSFLSSQHYLIYSPFLFVAFLNDHCHLLCFRLSSSLSPLSYLTNHLLLLHVDPFSCSPFNCLSLFIPSSIFIPQYWRLHPHRVFLLLWVPGPGEARRASELALHVLDDRGYLRLRHGLGHHPTLRWEKQTDHSVRKSLSKTICTSVSYIYSSTLLKYNFEELYFGILFFAI